MNVRLHIEHLILDGLPIEAAQAPAVQGAVEAELSRLLTERGLAPELRQGGAVPYARGEDLRPAEDNTPARLGESIARAVHGGIRP